MSRARALCIVMLALLAEVLCSAQTLAASESCADSVSSSDTVVITSSAAADSLPTSERTFVALKPDAVQRGLVGAILRRFERKGLQIVALKTVHATRAQAELHYVEHTHRPFFRDLVAYFTSGPIVCVALAGKDAVQSVRAIMGTTRPLEAAPGTIRFDLAVDAARNLVHGSDSVAAAERELAHWFAAAELLPWTPSMQHWLQE